MKRNGRNSEVAPAPLPQAEAPPLEPAAIRGELGKVLASPEFNGAARLCEFLSFVVEESLKGSDSIKETAIALEVFNRRASFDPSGDSVVRVAAHGLRNRLRDYYLGSGKRDQVVIEIPKGTYAPVFRRVPSAGAAAPPRPGMPWKTIAIAASILALLSAAAWWLLPGARNPFDRSIAVLPIANLGEPEADRLCQGMTEDLTTELARLPQLRVIARSSATQFRAQGEDLREVAKRLGVATVLEGAVRRHGNNVRFTAQLIDARTRYNLWSETYDRDAADLFAAEAEVIPRIAAGAAWRLGVRDLAPIAPAHVPLPRARELFWQARYLRSESLNLEAWGQAQTLLERAVQIDPRYVEAYSSLATVAVTRAFHRLGSFEELTAQVRNAANRALQFDERNVGAQLTLAELEWLQARDWPAAERHFRRILELNPSASSAHHWFATGLWSRGAFDQALAQLDAATALDPLPFVVSNDRATLLYCARRYDQAIARARQVLNVDPKFYWAHLTIGDCLVAMGRLNEAIAEFRFIPEDRKTAVAGALGHALALTGHRTEALDLLRLLQANPDAYGDARISSAYIRLGLGDRSAALASLEDSFAHYETDANFIAVNPVLDPLRDEPRFRALLQKLGF